MVPQQSIKKLGDVVLTLQRFVLRVTQWHNIRQQQKYLHNIEMHGNQI